MPISYQTFDSWLNVENKEVKENRIEKNQEKKVGRNDKCPCGSGKKFKHCHGNI